MILTRYSDAIAALNDVSRQAFEVLAGMRPESPQVARRLSPAIESWVDIINEQEPESRLLIRADVRCATTFSARFLETPAADEIDRDVIDAFKELANTIGGNLKGLLGEATELSLPETFVGSRLSRHRLSLAETSYTFADGAQCAVELLGPA